MASGGIGLRIALAALVSGATAGMLLALAFFLAVLVVGPPGPWWTLAMLIDWLQIGCVAGLVIATLPAWLAGLSMWALGASYGAARHPLAWAAAGAGVGGALWVLFGPLLGNMARDGLDRDELALLAASLLAGAGAGLAFLAAMRLTGAPARAGKRA
jgi:hypothetical protein